MKKLLFLLIAANGVLSATAQMKDSTKKRYLTDAEMQHWVVDVNLLGGVLTQNYTTGNSLGNYTNAVNANYGNLKFTNGTSFGFDAQLGYFFGNSNHFGIGAGFMYLAQQGNATLNQFHVEFQSTDGFNNISREEITASQPVKEALRITNINIPLVLKYKDRFSKHWGFTADAGILYNVQMKNMYNSNASFDYEEVVQYVKTENGNIVSIYDNGTVPNSTDLQITKAQFANTAHPNGETLQQFFASERALGYNVGLGVKPNSNTGSVSYTSGSIGLLLQPSINYFFSDKVALNVGVYYIYQPSNNTPTNGYRLTNNLGDYSSVLNNVSKTNAQTYGGNLGVRFLFGKEAAKPVIIGEDAVDPTACGLSDGSITLHGLKPGKDVQVIYTVNGVTNSLYTGTVEANGNVKLTGLGAGAYTNIVATLGKHHLDGTPVNLVNPPMNISEYSTNPTAAGTCDGTITFNGLRAGQNVTVNYNFNGVAKPAYSGVVASNNTVKLTGLCAGTYTQIVVAMNSCTANGSDMTLTEPQPVQVAAPPAAAPLADITTPILFEFGKTKIHPSSYPTLEKAVLEVGKDNDYYIICEGHTDNTGKVEVNELLSFKRAEAVKKYLIKLGVNGDRIIAVGRGSRMPIASNDTPEGRSKNRRVVMTLNDHKK